MISCCCVNIIRFALPQFSPQVISFNKRNKYYTRSGCSISKPRYRFNIHLHHAPALKERLKREKCCSKLNCQDEKTCKFFVLHCIILELIRQQNEERMDEKMDGMQIIVRKGKHSCYTIKNFPPSSLCLTKNIKQGGKEKPTENERGDNLTQNNFSQQQRTRDHQWRVILRFVMCSSSETMMVHKLQKEQK